MASETADKEAPPIATSTFADELVGASETSSQNTDESVKNSQDSETKETKQEEESAEAKSAAATEKEDVAMKEEGDDTKEEEANLAEKQDEDVEMTETKDEAEEMAANEEKASSKDVAMTSAAEVKEEDNEEKTEEEESTAESAQEAEAKENAVHEADEKAMEGGDVEMKVDDETAQEASSNASGAAATATETREDAVSKPDDASPAKQKTPAKTPDSAAADANAEESDHIDVEMQDSSKSSSPKRKEPVQAPASETSNGVNGVAAPAEPAAKKQKVGAIDAMAPENTVVDATTAATDRADGASPSGVISRDDMAKMEEDSGRLKFDVITNDGTDEHMVQLTTLKNIFAKQLPKMPKEYIVRLVFDKNHRSMLILKNGTHVIGGICYRPFEKNGFAEIAFCAINASDQVKGYGTRLMNHLKEYVKTKNIMHFLTYADNYAIGYFKKQGFTKSVSMARPNWYGYIKDYDGGTLMECTIHTQINYLRITSMIHMQRKAIQDKIQERSRSKTVYPSLERFAEGRLMDIYMVPGVKEAGWSQAVIRNNRIGTRDQGSLKSQLSQLLKAVSNHRSAWPFHEPVDTTVVVDYLDHIKEPVDLQLISKRIDSGTYISKAVFKADLDKMCENCTIYNTPDTNYYKAAMDLREFIQSRIQIRDHK